jgi:hypothetical protein
MAGYQGFRFPFLTVQDLIASMVFLVTKAAEKLVEETAAPNRFWKTDFNLRRLPFARATS